MNQIILNFYCNLKKNNFEKNDIQVYIMDSSYCLKWKRKTKKY